MTTAIDTNVIIALWQTDETFNRLAEKLLRETASQGQLVIAAPVFAELMAETGRAVHSIEAFCRESAIRIDWTLDEKVWRIAGAAYQSYTSRRRKRADSRSRRILADFLIGAHALRFGYRLLTFDRGTYTIDFPQLRLVPV